MYFYSRPSKLPFSFLPLPPVVYDTGSVCPYSLLLSRYSFGCLCLRSSHDTRSQLAFVYELEYHSRISHVGHVLRSRTQALRFIVSGQTWLGLSVLKFSVHEDTGDQPISLEGGLQIMMELQMKLCTVCEVGHSYKHQVGDCYTCERVKG